MASPGPVEHSPLLDPRTGEHVLGLEPGTVRLREYTPLWAELFAMEAAQIRVALGIHALDVQHVGSTAVPGLMAKPILDIAVAIPSDDLVADCVMPLAGLGYQYARWVELEGDFLFEKGIERTHHVHLVECESCQWRDYLRFRNALLTNAELAAEYERMKIELHRRFRGNRPCYTSAKSQFIRHVLAAA